MHPAEPLPLATWQTFYAIIGSSAGALTGLQFVVLTLLAQSRTPAKLREIHAFGTPTVVHFGSALVIAALMTVPLHALTSFGICLGILGVGGLVYSLRIIFHARKADYNPDVEDWIWYGALPLLAHVALLATAFLLCRNDSRALLLVAAITVFFLILGIHNSWDTVTYIVTQKAAAPSDLQDER